MNTISARPMVRPEPLNEEYIQRHKTYITERAALLEKKQILTEKSAKILEEINSVEKTIATHAWSRKDTNKELLKRLNSDFEGLKIQILAVDKEIENLNSTNNTLNTLIKIYESRVKGYEEYLVWKEQTTLEIYEAYMKGA